MAATLSKVGSIGDFDIVAVTGDASYATGGYDISAVLGPQRIAEICGGNASHFGSFDAVSRKLLFRLQTTGAEVANLTNISSSVLLILVA